MFMKKLFLSCCMLLSTLVAGAQTITVKVIGVSDGDTVRVLTANKENLRVRLSEIDAPESSQAFGTRSKQALSDICFGKSALISLDEQDRYGRYVSRLVCEGVDAQSHMVGIGMAWVYDRYAKDETLYAHQDNARAERRGLWRDANPTPPWNFRRTKRN